MIKPSCLGKFESIFYIDAQIADRVLNFRMTEQNRDGSQVVVNLPVNSTDGGNKTGVMAIRRPLSARGEPDAATSPSRISGG